MSLSNDVGFAVIVVNLKLVRLLSFSGSSKLVFNTSYLKGLSSEFP